MLFLSHSANLFKTFKGTVDSRKPLAACKWDLHTRREEKSLSSPALAWRLCVLCFSQIMFNIKWVTWMWTDSPFTNGTTIPAWDAVLGSQGSSPFWDAVPSSSLKRFLCECNVNPFLNYSKSYWSVFSLLRSRSRVMPCQIRSVEPWFPLDSWKLEFSVCLLTLDSLDHPETALPYLHTGDLTKACVFWRLCSWTLSWDSDGQAPLSTLSPKIGVGLMHHLVSILFSTQPASL